MPTNDTPPTDPLTSMIEIHSSAVFEMLLSLEGIHRSKKMTDLREEASVALGREFLDVVDRLYGAMAGGMPYVEMGVEYESRDNVEGFVDYVEAMSDREFAFQVTCRFIERERIPEHPNSADLRKLVNTDDLSGLLQVIFAKLDWADDIPGHRTALTTLWRQYWSGFFRQRLASVQSGLNDAVEANRRVLETEGGSAAMTRIRGTAGLPDAQPAGYPVTRVEMIPVHHTFRKLSGASAYGSFQQFFDYRNLDGYSQQMSEYKSRSLLALKALADENRLRIVRVIAHNPRIINGSTIARYVGLSQSVVSRHLAQLKATGIIKEHTHDNRNLTYSLDGERIDQMAAELSSYIREW